MAARRQRGEGRVHLQKKANTYFFMKMIINLMLVIIGSAAIGLFLKHMQEQTALTKQQENCELSLKEAVSILKSNEKDAKELTDVFHDSNQDTVDDLKELLMSGLFDSLEDATEETRTEVFSDMVDRTGVQYLFIMDEKGNVMASPFADYVGKNLTQIGLLKEKNLAKLVGGTLKEDGTIDPARENNEAGHFYFYSSAGKYKKQVFYLILGTDVSSLDMQLESLKDVAVVLERSPVGNNGFLFAVDTKDNTFLYYKNGEDVLTGTNALEAGLSEKALQDGYVGKETIKGVNYYCVSKSYGKKTVICAVADTEDIFANDKYVLFWSILGFVLVMALCLAYAVIVRNDFVRRAVKTDRKVLFRSGKSALIFDRSVFRKIFPLMIVGVMLIFGISFYTQTLLEISQCIDNSIVALEEVSGRYEESTENRKTIQDYYNNSFLGKAIMIAYLLEEDPSALNEKTTRLYATYDDGGDKYYILDDEGNFLRSVGSSKRLQEFCDKNNMESIYVFDERGHTIGTNTENWYFTISHNEEDQSYAFLNVLDGKLDYLVQEPMVSDVGTESQFIGVAFDYYTRMGDNGETEYVSRFEYEKAQGLIDTGKKKKTEDAEEADDSPEITEHHSLMQIGLDAELTKKILASTELEYVFSSNMLKGGFMVLFDATEDHVCLYSPYETRIGMKAADLEVPEKAFSGEDYYGFTRVNGVSYFQYFRYKDGYFIGTAIPEEGMFRSRMMIAVITAVTSLILILILSATVTLTSKEEEMLYATMSDEEARRGINKAIFTVLLPSGREIATVSATARWDNKNIPWSQKTPEQKLMVMISGIMFILVIYVIFAVVGARSVFQEGSVIPYILSGNWDKGPNIFAFSAFMLVLIFTGIAVALFRIPVRIFSSLLGARGETIGHLLISVAKYGGALGAVFYGLYLFGVDSSSLLASAGLLSLVIGLGAQSLIKDILAGIFIVFEGEFRVGDIVTINNFRGTVMDIGLRTTKILGPDGNVKIYNNSEISGVLNMTKDASVAACEIDVEYGQDLEYVEKVLEEELPKLKKTIPAILDGPDYKGVNKLGESGVTLVIVAKCNEEDIKAVTRGLNKGILQIFYRNGINVPFPNVTISTLDPHSSHEEEREPERPVKKDEGLFQ